MPWHQSKSDPRKVYDSHHQTVCVCMNVEQAVLIVRAVNAMPGSAQDSFVKLLEPSTPAGKESAESSNTEPEGRRGENAQAAASLTHVTAQADGCCAVPIRKASLSGVLDQMRPWECPKCGTTYWPNPIAASGGMVNWEARASVVVFKP